MIKALFVGDIGVQVYLRGCRSQNQILRLNGACRALGDPGQHFVREKSFHLNPCNPGLECRGNPGLMLADPEKLTGFQGDLGFTEKEPISGNLIHVAGHLNRRGILLFQKGHETGEGLVSGLNPGCSQEKWQYTE